MPVAIDLGILLAVLTAVIVTYGFLLVYRGTFKPLLLAVADLLDVSIHIPRITTIRPFSTLAGWVRNAALAIDHALATAYLRSEKALASLWNGLAKQAEWLGSVLGDLAETVERRLRALVHSTVPRLIGDVRRFALRELHALRAAIVGAATATEAELAKLRRGIDRTAKRLEGAISSGLANVRARVGALERTARGELSRLRHVEGRLTAVGAAALVGAALARLGLGWVKCPRVARTGKAVCGMDGDLLDTLLADALVIASTVSLVEFAHEMQAIIRETDRLSRGFFRVA